MIGMKEICGLLLAGSMGAGSVVAVQKVKPVLSRPKPKPVAPKAHKTASRNITHQQILDCPVTVVALSPLAPELGAIPPLNTPPDTSHVAGWPGGGGIFIPPPIGGGGGGGGGISKPDVNPNPPAPPIPEPASWAMMVTGFGLVGLALRKGPEPEATEATDA